MASTRTLRHIRQLEKLEPPSERFYDRVQSLRVGIPRDWNLALTANATDLVTVAHQHDLDSERYFERLSAGIQRHPETAISFGDFEERTLPGPSHVNADVPIKQALFKRAFGNSEPLGHSPPNGACWI